MPKGVLSQEMLRGLPRASCEFKGAAAGRAANKNAAHPASAITTEIAIFREANFEAGAWGWCIVVSSLPTVGASTQFATLCDLLDRWRSWLARLHDTEKVTGSSPVRST